MRWTPSGPEATREAGRRLAEAVSDEGLVLALEGPLGAGKTAFVQGLAEGLGIDPATVTSPTFVIASEYRCPEGRRLAHVDAYRLSGAAELQAAGFDDLLERGAVVAVEWADRVPDALPPDRLALRIERDPAHADRRLLDAIASGAAARAALERWRAAMAEAP